MSERTEERVRTALADEASQHRPDVDALWARTRSATTEQRSRRLLAPLAAALVAIAVVVGVVAVLSIGESDRPSGPATAPPTPTPSSQPDPALTLSVRGHKGDGPIEALKSHLPVSYVRTAEIVLMDVRGGPRAAPPDVGSSGGAVFTYGFACSGIEGPTLCVAQLQTGDVARAVRFVSLSEQGAVISLPDIGGDRALQLELVPLARGLDGDGRQVFEGDGWPKPGRFTAVVVPRR